MFEAAACFDDLPPDSFRHFGERVPALPCFFVNLEFETIHAVAPDSLEAELDSA